MGSQHRKTKDTPAFRILLTEDNEVQAFLLRAHFEKGPKPPEIRHAKDGVEFFESLYDSKNGLAWPDLIIMDISMPRMNGLQVLEKLKQDSGANAIPVLMLSGHNDEKNIASARQLGAQGYVVKGTRVTLDEMMSFAQVAKDEKNLWVCIGKANDPG